MSYQELEEPRCPICGGRVIGVIVIGPDQAIIAPCRHRAPPDAVESDWPDSINDYYPARCSIYMASGGDPIDPE